MTTRPIMMIATGLAALVLSGSAFADDTIIDAPEVTISAASAPADYYVRGDLGYAGLTGNGDPSLGVAGAQPGFTHVDFDEARFSRPVSGTFGIGMRITDIIRADLTGDYFEGRFTGTDAISGVCAGEPAGTSCAGDVRADYRALGLMANGYADFGTLAGFTPYLGAGIGATRMSYSDAALTRSCTNGTAACLDGAPGTLDYRGESNWRFTYALMAGVSYDVTDRLKIDLSYRYSDIGSGEMFGGADAHGRDDGLQRHEVRAGLRVMLW